MLYYFCYIIPAHCLREPELKSIMGDLVLQEIQDRILMAVRQSHTNKNQIVHLLDSKVRSLYTAASGLVNDGVETLRGYGKVLTALDVCQQSILRKSGPFVKPTTSKAATKPGKDKATTGAMSLAANTAKKRRSRGRGRKNQGLSPHVAPPPHSGPSATSLPAPAASPVHLRGVDARRQYRQELLRQLQTPKSGSKELPCSPAREK